MHLTFISNLTRIFWRYYNFVPKRLKFFAATFINYALINAYIYFWGTAGSFKIGFIFGCISVFLYIFSVLFGLTRSNFFKSISVPAVFIVSTFLILNYFPNLNLYFKLTFGLFSGLLYYFLLLSINVFFVVEEKGSSIPLLRPAKTTFLMIEVVKLFLF